MMTKKRFFNRMTKKYFIILLILVGLSSAIWMNRPKIEALLEKRQQEIRAEQIIQAFMADKGMNIRPGTEEYILFMRDILWGVYPELRESDSAFIQHPEEVGYISDYAWKYSEYEKFHGGYIEPEIEEAKPLPHESDQ